MPAKGAMRGRFIKKQKREEEEKEEEKEEAEAEQGEDVLGKLAEKHAADQNIAPETSRYEEVIAAGIKRKGLPRLQLPAGPSEQQNMNTDLSPKEEVAY